MIGYSGKFCSPVSSVSKTGKPLLAASRATFGLISVMEGSMRRSCSSNPASSGAVKGLSFGFDANLEHGWIQAVRNNGSEKRDLELQPIGGNV
jgi:hypothetical protein